MSAEIGVFSQSLVYLGGVVWDTVGGERVYFLSTIFLTRTTGTVQPAL